MLLLILSLFAFAGEPDNFSGRNTPPQNNVINEYIQAKLREVAFYHNTNNKNSNKCNDLLLKALTEKTFDRNWPDVYELANKARADGPRDIRKSVLNGSVRPLFMVPSFTLKFKNSNYSVGLDKIDHFFAHGYLYWKIIGEDPKLPQEKVLKALTFGMAQEDGAWGLKSSGVKSYGDLSANYQGLGFWRDLWHGKPPFFACVNGQVKIQKTFKIEEYMTGAVDEAINCSSYATSKTAEAIRKKTETLGRKCPVDQQKCWEFRRSMPVEYESLLFHPLCRGMESDQVEKASNMSTKDLMDSARALISGGDNVLKMLNSENPNVPVRKAPRRSEGRP